MMKRGTLDAEGSSAKKAKQDAQGEPEVDGGRGERGERRRRRRKRRERRERPQQKVDGEERGAGYPKLVKENEIFEKYYKGQDIVPVEEWDLFLSTMRESLPATFRITGTRLLAESVRACLEKRFFSELSGLQVEGEEVPPPEPLPWYPNRLAWHVKLSKRFIRKSPLVSKFHSFLVRENEQGNISRQEAVSMLPPILLDVKPHHKVLDMCAAPGSKTAQLIEFLHAEDYLRSDATMPSGVIVANDADNNRCYMLVHQAKRLNSPCFMVTNHDASVYPILYHHDEMDVRHPLYYDRVLCDVPCSGDGTLRKNPVIWRQWTPSRALALHKLQLRILNRGLELLVPGGRLVYSTCSINPVEDEAVVATALQLCKGAVELVDWSGKLPGLRTVAGMSSWKVMLKGGTWVNTHSDVPRASRVSVPQSVFPPEPKDVGMLHLERCGRILPHHQDTGGFFVAVLEKKDWLPWQRRKKLAAKVGSTVKEKQAQAREEEGGIEERLSSDVTVTPSCLDTSESTFPNPDTTTRAPEITSELCDTSTASKDTIASPSDTTQDVTRTTSASALASQTAPETLPDEEPQSGVAMEVGVVSECAPEGQKLPESGGMVVQKVEEMEGLESRDGEEELDGERPKESILGKPGFQQRKKCFKEDPYVFLGSDSDVFKMIKPHFGLPDNFPADQLLSRTLTGKKRNIYLTSHLIKELTLRNEHSVKIINIGVKVLSRCEHQKASCTFRLCQEGVDAMVPFITDRVVPVSKEDVECLLLEPNPLALSLSLQAQQALQGLDIGPALFKYTPGSDTRGLCDPASDSTDGSTDSSAFSYPLSLSGWVAAKSVRLYVDRKYRYHFLAVMGHDPPENQSLVPVCGEGRPLEGEKELDVEEVGENFPEEVIDEEGEAEEAIHEEGEGSSDKDDSGTAVPGN